MKYIVVDERSSDVFTDEYEVKEEAVKAAELAWSRMSSHDRKDCTSFYVLESVNPDEDAWDHLDGNCVLTIK